jgi:hypothetical protein
LEEEMIRHFEDNQEPNIVFNLTYLAVTVLAFGNNRASQNAG